MISRNVRFFIILLLLGFSFFLRVYNISSTPPVLQEKELRIGLAVLTNNINVLNIAPLSIIATIPFVKIFGLSSMSVRLPSVIFAFFSIIIFFFLMRKKFSSIAFLALLFITISPFSIQIARIDTGINMGLFFFLLGIYGITHISKSPKILLFVTIPFAFSIYADYMFLLPSIGAYIMTVIIAGKAKSKNFIMGGIGLCCLILCIVPILSKSIGYTAHIDDTDVYVLLQNKQTSEGRIAYSMHSAFAKILYNSDIENIKFHVKHITQYFEPHQLFFTWTHNQNYLSQNSGLFYPIDLIFFIAGIIYLLKKNQPLLTIFSVWVIASIVPVAIVNIIPDASRVIIALPPVIVINALGIRYLFKNVNGRVRIIFLGGILVLGSYFVLRFFHMYFTVYPESFSDYQIEYGKAFLYEKNNFPKSQPVMVTDATFGKNIYLYSLFLNSSATKLNYAQGKNANSIATYTNYAFLSQSPATYTTLYNYIQPTETVPQGMHILFTSKAKDTKLQISVFTPYKE